MSEYIRDAWWHITNWFWHRFLCDHCRYMRKHVKELDREA